MPRLAFLRGGGEMGERMRRFDWARHPLGPAADWPQSLKSAVSICLGSRFPILLWWGPELFMLYNDAYRPMLGTSKHPGALGQAGRDCWPEIWHIIGPMLEQSVLARGEATWSDDQLLVLDRNEYHEECYFTFTYSPIRDESGAVGGVFCAVVETTARVIGERRLRLLKELPAAAMGANDDGEACRRAAEVLAAFPADVPFALLYLTDGDGVRLAASAGVPTGHAIAPEWISFDDRSAPWDMAAARRESAPVVVDGIHPGCREVASSWPDCPVTTAVLVALGASGSEAPTGYMVAGVSPRRALDEEYRSLLRLVAGHIASAIVDARAYEAERRRASALAELDRAKTLFFSDVSHEFRTPLTLILGPARDALASPDRNLTGEALDTVYRNALRLQKLVNTLLDFSRLEAGRLEACFEATDLAALTADVASVFRSAMEQAGLRYDVTCPPLTESVYVDRAMWETILLNLLSNAFKYTLDGAVSVSLGQAGNQVELTVRDTGTGIAAEHLPHLFERFYRVKGARARTYEGSGIGLAMVQELVKMHGGKLAAESQQGRGTTFLVTVPLGLAHLPPERVNASRSHQSTSTTATAYVEEALRWLPAADAAEPGSPGRGWRQRPPAHAQRILLVDDNADMREYVRRLLEERWFVETASNGGEALAAARERPPDAIVTDVMMPVLDGFGLLRAIRADDRLKDTPVVVLSARAGEDARIEGLAASADDYLAKPFSARELIARVEAQLTRVWMRRLEATYRERLLETFREAPIAIAMLRGPDYVYEFVNAPYRRLIGRRPVLGKPLREALPELADQGVFEVLDHVYASGEPYTAEAMRATIHRGLHGAPEECFFKVTFQPSRDLQGDVSGILVAAIEVTELARARREAEAANRAKDEFLAMLGHELRNPLAPILTALQLMRLRGEGGERERSIIERQVKHVVRLVDDLLDVSRITRGKVQLEKQRVAIAQVTAKAIEMASPMLEQRRHLLSVDVPRDGCVVEGDPARLAQVIANLLTNAAKYTDPGGRVSVAALEEGEDVVLTVTDTGIGIAPEVLPRIFDLFAQDRQPLDRSEGGLGLGLALVRSFVALHGGTVTARSDGPGLGAEFVVRLPRAAARPGQAALDSDEARRLDPQRAWRVLIVDDNEDAAAMLSAAFGQCGHETRTASEGLTGLALAEAFHPDVALLDIGLPVIDGYELARRFRDHPRLRQTRLVAVTGYGQEHDRNRSEAAGFDAHLVKPVDLDELVELIDHLARQRHGLDAKP